MSSDQPSGHPAEPAAHEAPFTATGERVEVRPPSTADIEGYAAAVTLSERRLSDFAVPDPNNLPVVLDNQSPTYRTFMVHALDPEGSHGLVGRINVANVVGGAFRSASIGYDSYDPYAGRGLFVEGLRLTLDLVFADPPHGMGLHRVEANIQPANHRSAGLVRSVGFVHEGFSRHFLHLPGIDGRRDWRDHDRFAMLSSDWPCVPYRPHGHRRIACVVRGAGSSGYGYGGTSLGAAVATELGIPLYSSTVVESTAALFELLRSSPVGGVVECRSARSCSTPSRSGRPTPDAVTAYASRWDAGVRVRSTPPGLAEWRAVPVRPPLGWTGRLHTERRLPV